MEEELFDTNIKKLFLVYYSNCCLKEIFSKPSGEVGCTFCAFSEVRTRAHRHSMKPRQRWRKTRVLESDRSALGRAPFYAGCCFAGAGKEGASCRRRVLREEAGAVAVAR